MSARIPITPDEMRDAIQDMHLTLPKYQLTAETMPRTVQLYREALLPYDGEAVRGGADILRRTADKFPAPAAWRTAIQEWVKRNRASIERKGEQDAQGRDIVCKKCRSVGKWAWLKRPDGTEFQRMVAFCDPAKHEMGELIVPMPENFLEWSV